VAEITLGRHRPYREVVYDWEQELLRAMAKIDGSCEADRDPQCKDKLAPIVKGWQASATAREVLAQARAHGPRRSRPERRDKDVERNVKADPGGDEEALDDWAAIEKGWRRWSLNEKLTKIREFKETPLYGALLRRPHGLKEEAHEKDAYATGDPVKAQFTAASRPRARRRRRCRPALRRDDLDTELAGTARAARRAHRPPSPDA
jgi:hypothetical protein